MEKHKCQRCKRERLEKFLYRKDHYGKRVWRCRARSVCSSIKKRSEAAK